MTEPRFCCDEVFEAMRSNTNLGIVAGDTLTILNVLPGESGPRYQLDIDDSGYCLADEATVAALRGDS